MEEFFHWIQDPHEEDEDEEEGEDLAAEGED